MKSEVRLPVHPSQALMLALASACAAVSRLGGSQLPEAVRRALCGQVRKEC